MIPAEMIPAEQQNEAGDSDAPKSPGSNPARVNLDRRAEALRANLQRRKAQSRDRAEAQRDHSASRSDPQG